MRRLMITALCVMLVACIGTPELDLYPGETAEIRALVNKMARQYDVPAP